MAYQLGAYAGALALGWLLSRFFLAVFKFMEPSVYRVYFAFGVAWGLSIVISGFGNANGGPWNPWVGLLPYTVGFGVWLVVELLARKGRMANPPPEVQPMNLGDL